MGDTLGQAGPPSALQKCKRCGQYFTFDTETKEPSAPCRFHPKPFTAFGGPTGGTLAYGNLPPYWRCCGASKQHAPGCKVLSYHVQDDSFMDMTVQYTYTDRESVDLSSACPGLGSSSNDGSTSPLTERKSETKTPPVPESEWIEVRLAKSDTVSSLAVKYGTAPVVLRLVNKLGNDMMLMSRNTVLVPPNNPSAAPPPMTEDEVRDRMVRRLRKRAGMGSLEEARYYLDAAGGDVERAVVEYQGDVSWEGRNAGLAKGKGILPVA